MDFLKFKSWLDEILNTGNFERVSAFNFNLYEDYSEIDSTLFSVQLIGAPSYNSFDSDWACNEVFTSGENLFTITDCDDWEECLIVFEKLINEYLQKSKKADVLKEKIALTYGFVDGDLEIVFEENH